MNKFALPPFAGLEYADIVNLCRVTLDTVRYLYFKQGNKLSGM